MNFIVKDVEQFQAQKQFIDTAIVPLVQLDFSDQGMKQSSSASEYLMTLTNFIEQQFKGRLLLLPPFSYTMGTKSDKMPAAMEKELKEAGFKAVVFITCDHSWTELKEYLNIIWLPAIPLESMDQGVKQRILEDQLKQVIPTFTKIWV
ncbi:YpiF family protein [Solibacillus sp. FSL R5-0449]|uniref:YpiF family protein n=1 Tax=Solibacillus sp. FSL R5-0449 TaxID=2921639 RepID=UPI0030D506EB